MTFTYTSLAAILAGALTYNVAIEPHLEALFNKSMDTAKQVEQINRSEILKGATVYWQIHNGTTAVPTVDQLVAGGFLDKSYTETTQ